MIADMREMRERVPARVLHLNSHERMAIERAVRVLRACFVDHRPSAPEQGTLHALMLVGDHADTTRPVPKSRRERPTSRFGRSWITKPIRSWISTGARHGSYTAEFALKSVLLHAGYSDGWNRENIGLDVGLAYREALKCGLPAQPSDVEQLLNRLGHYHDGERTPEQADDVLAAMPSTEIVKTIWGLLNTIGEITG